MSKKLALVILDGFGINTKTPNENAITLAPETPTIDWLFSQSHAQLLTHGRAVGLPADQMGNSEVGHMTIGSGRVNKQTLVEIDDMLDDGSFTQLPSFQAMLAHCKTNNTTLHIMTLFGPGGVHASDTHLIKLLPLLPKEQKVMLHLFGDGRDVPPQTMAAMFAEFHKDFLVACPNVTVATIAGRYYAMDRDTNRDRVAKAYDELVRNKTKTDLDPHAYILEQYKKNITDEFLEPVSFAGAQPISDGDGIFFLNYRADRAKQLTKVLVASKEKGEKEKKKEKEEDIYMPFLGTTIPITIDRPLGSVHPKYPDMIYPINYGFVPGTIAGDGKEIDVFVLGIDKPIDSCDCVCIGISKRHNDNECKLIACPAGMSFTKEKIEQQIHFQEQYFDHEIILAPFGSLVVKPVSNLFLLTMTQYYADYTGPVCIIKDNLVNTLGEVIANAGLTQLRLAETEKFAHVTRFFNGEKDMKWSGETDILIPSHKVATYDLDPEMSVEEIYETFEKEVCKYDFCFLNFANGDMVGHTGSMVAAQTAVQKLDDVLGRMISFCAENDIELLITADHGNCEEMGTIDEPKTSHTLNPVPCWHLWKKEALPLVAQGSLADLAPTVLTLLELPIPNEMTGKVLTSVVL